MNLSQSIGAVVIGLLNRFFKRKEIVNCDRDLYLTRWYIIRTKAFALFIHRFIRSDEDRALHDHPWAFLVIPVWRGYIEHSERTRICHDCDGEGEEYFAMTRKRRCRPCNGTGRIAVPVKQRVLPILGTRLRPATYKHRVELLPCTYSDNMESDCEKCGMTGALPSWSIFLRFREVRDWGFHMPGGWVQWAAFWREKCE